jgi:hypothetical protein
MLKYFDTNKLIITDPSQKQKYLSGLITYFLIRRNEPILDDNYREFMNAEFEKIKEAEKKLEKGEDITGFKVTNIGNIGFTEEIIYEEECFKLRLFYDEELEKVKGLVNEMGQLLKSFPESIGMKVIEEHEDIKAPKTYLTLDSIRESYISYLKGKVEKDETTLETKYAEVDHEHFEQHRNDVENATQGSLRIPTLLSFTGKDDYKEKLKKTVGIFEEIQDHFKESFPEKEYILDCTAYGTFPHIHSINEATALTQETFYFLPNTTPHVPCISLLDAEIFSKPTELIEQVISIYPYTSTLPEINNYMEEFLEDEDLMKALIAHEFAEIVLSNPEDEIRTAAFMSSEERYLTNMMWQQRNINKHISVNELLYEQGYGKETEKLIDWYLEKYNELKTSYQERYRELGEYGRNEDELILNRLHLLEDGIKNLEIEKSFLPENDTT